MQVHIPYSVLVWVAVDLDTRTVVDVRVDDETSESLAAGHQSYIVGDSGEDQPLDFMDERLLQAEQIADEVDWRVVL